MKARVMTGNIPVMPAIDGRVSWAFPFPCEGGCPVGSITCHPQSAAANAGHTAHRAILR